MEPLTPLRQGGGGFYWVYKTVRSPSAVSMSAWELTNPTGYQKSHPTPQRQGELHEQRIGETFRQASSSTDQQETSFSRRFPQRQLEDNPGLRQRKIKTPTATPGNSGSTSSNRGTPYQRPATARTPLLRGSTSTTSLSPGSATGVASTAVTTSGVSLAKAGAVGAVTGLALGNIISSGVTLPGSDYIGPGNPINIDAPRHEADAIAKEHDVAYQRLIEDARINPHTHREFRERVALLDQAAIDAFHKDYIETGSFHSLFAKYGLKVKQFAEKRVGSIYPRKPGKCLLESLRNLFHLIVVRDTLSITKGNADTLGNNFIKV